jgi:hypothetical protein
MLVSIRFFNCLTAFFSPYRLYFKSYLLLLYFLTFWYGRRLSDCQAQDGCTALDVAADNGFTDTVRLLLDAGADTGGRDVRESIYGFFLRVFLLHFYSIIFS